MSDDVPSEQTLRRVVSILNTDETVNFLTNYFANHRELSEKTLGSVPLKEREVIAADGQNINATRSSKNGNDARKDSGIDIAPSGAIVSVTVISEIAEKDINVCADIRGKLRSDIEFKFCIGV